MFSLLLSPVFSLDGADNKISAPSFIRKELIKMGTGYTNQKKMDVIQYWVNHPQETNQEIAKHNNIAHTTFYRWRNDKWFMEQYHKLCKKRFSGLQALAISKLTTHLEEGHFNAVKYVLDSQGYNATQKIVAESPTTIMVTIEGDTDADKSGN